MAARTGTGNKIKAGRVVKPASQPAIQNLVFTANLGANMAMRIIAQYFRTQYNISLFTAAIAKLKNPRCTILVFDSGLVVCTGCKSFTDAEIGLKRFKNMTERLLRVRIFLTDITLQNIVCSGNFGFPLDLYSFWLGNQLHVNYEPDLFPGAHKAMKDLGTMLKVFPSGSFIITGAKTLLAMALSVLRTYQTLPKFRMHYHRTHRETLQMIQNMARPNGEIHNYFDTDEKAMDLSSDLSALPAATAVAPAAPSLSDLFSPFNIPGLLPPPSLPPIEEVLGGA